MIKKTMYWKAKKIKSDGTEYFTYKYFKLINKPAISGPYYDPIEKMIKHPIKQELIIEERLVPTEKDFIIWHQANIRL